MSPDPTIRRVRRANPAPAAPIEDAALLAAIVATPPDPRLAQDAHAGPRRGRSRRTSILALGAVLSIGAATAWAVGAPGALGLFQSARNSYELPGSWHQDVVPGSVHRATSTTIPGVGEAELWFGRSRQGGFCTAIRLPDGQWAGTMRAGRRLSPLDGGGTAPGCQPTRQQANDAAPGSPIFVITGLDYDETIVNAPGPGRDVWRLTYGVVDGGRKPVRVLDRVSGRSAPVVEGHLFAIAIHDPDPTRFKENGLRLVALDAHGRVVAGDPDDAG